MTAYVLTVTPNDTDNRPIAENYGSAYDLFMSLVLNWNAHLTGTEFADLLDGEPHEGRDHTVSVELADKAIIAKVRAFCDESVRGQFDQEAYFAQDVLDILNGDL